MPAGDPFWASSPRRRRKPCRTVPNLSRLAVYVVPPTLYGCRSYCAEDRVMPAENDDWDKDCRQLFWDGFIMAGTLARTGGPKAKPFLAGTRWGLSLIID